MSALAVLNTFLGLAFKAIDAALGNAKEAQQLKAELERLTIEAGSKLREAQRDIIVAEAKGESWLQRNWRPLLMLWFAGLVGAYWLGFAAPNLPQDAVDGLLDIVYIGVGGYVIGRSAEKIVRTAAPAVKDAINPPPAKPHTDSARYNQ